MDELVVPGVDADMRNPGTIGMEKNKIAWLRGLNFLELSELTGRGMGEPDTDLSKNIEDKT